MEAAIAGYQGEVKAYNEAANEPGLVETPLRERAAKLREAAKTGSLESRQRRTEEADELERRAAAAEMAGPVKFFSLPKRPGDPRTPQPVAAPAEYTPVTPPATPGNPLRKVPQAQPGEVQILAEEPPGPTHETPETAVMLGAPRAIPRAKLANAEPGREKDDPMQAMQDLRALLFGAADGVPLKTESDAETAVNIILRGVAGFSTPEGVALWITGAKLGQVLPELLNTAAMGKALATHPLLAKGLDQVAKRAVPAGFAGMGAYQGVPEVVEGYKTGDLENFCLQVRQSILADGIAWQVPRQRVQKTPVCKQCGELRRKIGLQSLRRLPAFVDQALASVHDAQDVTQVMAEKIIPRAPAMKGLQLGSDKDRRPNHTDANAAGQRQRHGGADAQGIPAIGKAQNFFKGRHHVHRDTTYLPAAQGCVRPHVLLKAALAQGFFNLVIVRQSQHFSHDVNIFGGANGGMGRVGDQQAGHGTADKCKPVTKASPQAAGHQLQHHHVRVIRIELRRHADQRLSNSAMASARSRRLPPRTASTSTSNS